MWGRVVMPKYTKLKDAEGRIAPTNQRPDILADYFEKTPTTSKKKLQPIWGSPSGDSVLPKFGEVAEVWRDTV